MHVHSSEIYPDFVKILIEPFYRLCVFDIITSNDQFQFQRMSRTPFLNAYSNQRPHYTQLIQKMYNSYHNSSISLLQDQIAYHEDAQYLKRFYQEHQFSYKINMLSDFYKYHRELPRIFHQDINEIIQNFQEDWRGLQYKFVSKKIKEDQPDELPQTMREKTQRPVEKVLKNIQLSYYNFQNKGVKKHKAGDNLAKNKQSASNRNKKSMPLLPLYRFQKLRVCHQKSSIQHIANVLGNKDTNQLQKSKQRQASKKASVNNSIEHPKNLSRTKSKSNLITAFGLQQTKMTTVKPIKNNFVNVTDKTKTAQVSLQKTQSTKNFLQRKKSEVRGKVFKIQQKKQQGVKNMFKRLSQAKKSINVGR